MRRGVGVLLALVLGGVLVVLSPAAPAAACSCMEAAPVGEDDVAEYDAVFTGTVTGRRTGEDQRIEVAVDEVWKGGARATTVVLSPELSSSCGIAPEAGTEGLFLAVREPPGLTVYSCGGLRPTAEAAALGPGEPPEPGHLGPRLDGWLRPWVAAAGIVAAVGLAVAVVVGRRPAGPGARP